METFNTRTKEYKMVIEGILKERGHVQKSVTNNIDIRTKKPKPININKIRVDNCVAYYKIVTTEDTSGGWIEYTTPYSITTQDYINFLRKDKLDVIKGIESKLKKEKVEYKNCPELIIGKYYAISHSYGNPFIIKITGKTAQQYKYVDMFYSLPAKIQEEIDRLKTEQRNFSKRVDIDDCEIHCETNATGVLRKSRFGWKTSGHIESYYIRHYDNKLEISFYVF